MKGGASYFSALCLGLDICKMKKTTHLCNIGLCKTQGRKIFCVKQPSSCHIISTQQTSSIHREVRECLRVNGLGLGFRYLSSLQQRLDSAYQEGRSSISKLFSILQQCEGHPHSGILLITFWQGIWCSTY